MKTIALILEFWNGHHPTYMKFFSRTLLELGYRVMAFCPEPEELRDWVAVNCSGMEENLQVVAYREPVVSTAVPGRLKAKVLVYRRWQAAAEALKNACCGVTPDLVFFAYLDVYLDKYLSPFLLDSIFPFDWSGLYFAPTHLRLSHKTLVYRLNPLKRDAALRSGRCRSVAILDEGVTGALRESSGNRPVIVFPDFADVSSPDYSYPAVGLLRGKAGNRTVIGLVGCITKRKAILTLLEVARRSIQEDWLFFVAGNLDASTFTDSELATIKSFAGSDPANCLFCFEFIPDEASLNAIISSCDIIFAAYDNFYHSSNILTKAAFFRKNVIVSDGYCMAERVRKYRLGQIIDEGNVGQCIAAIRTLVTPRDPDAEKQGPDFESYVNDFSIERLQESFAAALAMP